MSCSPIDAVAPARRWPGGWSGRRRPVLRAAVRVRRRHHLHGHRRRRRVRRCWPGPRPQRRPRPRWSASARAVGEVPRNLLRCYVQFSAPMSEGSAARHVRLLDDGGDAIVGALLPDRARAVGRRPPAASPCCSTPPASSAAWSPTGEAGYPLRPGTTFRLVVDSGFPDATGTPLRERGRAALRGR